MAKGFFTDSTLCIGCKACEVACKEWNEVPADGFVWTGRSYDNTGSLGHSTWRHVIFVESSRAALTPWHASGVASEPRERAGGAPPQRAGRVGGPGGAGRRGPASAAVGRSAGAKPPGFSEETERNGLPGWEFSSDVCKHCEHAGCLEACPTGSIVRTEFGGVFVQPDICNGCGYCVVSCPFGVIDRRPDDGRAFKCTFCYDRQKAGLKPACATVCPTESIQYGDLDELRARADRRQVELAARGVTDAVVYDPTHTSVGGTHAIFLVRGDVTQFDLPPDPELPSVRLGAAWRSAAVAAMTIAGVLVLAFA